MVQKELAWVYKLPLSQVKANIKLFEPFSTPTGRRCEVRGNHQDSIVFEGAQVYPEYNAGNDPVRLRVTDFQGTERLRSKGGKTTQRYHLRNKTGSSCFLGSDQMKGSCLSKWTQDRRCETDK